MIYLGNPSITPISAVVISRSANHLRKIKNIGDRDRFTQPQQVRV
ncbi:MULTISPECIES: hypothetical protein [Planktothricoides]|uniref:Uncharacterized protein n=1 Tax=Planktothricoides raciborskii GIHE-MW2 TaxID=2792601 RepID=A0AAU8JFB6_9CYAN|nr:MULTISPECIES: hypothetical protein [Planktothricoides]